MYFMKTIIYLCTFLISVIFLSCNKEIIDPVETCSSEIPNDNQTNKKSDIYQSILDKYCAKGLPGISLAIRTNDDGLYLDSAGYARIEDKTKMKVCHLHHSASISKTYIATAVLILVEEGKIGLNDLAKNYLDKEIYTRVSNAEQATIKQLLNHSSAIYSFEENVKFYVNTLNNPFGHSSSLELIENYVYDMPAYSSISRRHYYSNTNYSLLGMIIEKASGSSLGEYIEDNIIIPFNLSNTYYKNSPKYPDMPNLVNSYYDLFGDNLTNCSDIQKHFANIAMGHEGIIATPYDFLLFIENLLAGNILSEKLTKEMLNIDDNEYYGLGIMRYKTACGVGFGHTGGSIGAGSFAIYFPDSQISFSMFCNIGAVGSDNISLFYYQLFDEIQAAISKD